MKISLFIDKFRNILNPPYSLNNISVLFGVLLLLIAIPFTVIAVSNGPTIRSKAAGVIHIVGSGGFSTINAAVAAASSGDTIKIKTGTYSEQVNVNKSISVVDYGDGSVVIDRQCSGTGPGVDITASGVTIKGLTIQNTVGASVLINGTTSAGRPSLTTVDGNTLQNFDCKFVVGVTDPSGRGQFYAGVASWYGGNGTRIINNVIKHRTSGNVHGTANGIWFKSNSSNPSGGGHLISGNTITGGWDGIGGEAEGDAHGTFDKNTTVENNTISNCWDDGIQAEGGDANVYIKNNNIQSCGTGIALAAPQTGPIYIENNSITNLSLGLYDNLFCYKIGNSGSGDIYLTGNTCRVDSAAEISQGGADGILQTNPNFSNKLILNDNIFRTSRYIYSITQNPTPSGTTFSHNCLSTTDAGRFVKWAGGVYYTNLASFQAGTGQEQTSQQTTDCSFLGGGGDTASPVVTISSPTNGATVSGTLNISASATDNIGVTSMQIKIDDNSVKTCSTTNCSFSWDTTTYTDTSHTVLVSATDAANNNGTKSITVTVNNAPISSCDTAFPNNKFHVCFFDGIDPATGTLIGERDEGTVSSPAPTIATPIDHVYVTSGEFGQTDTFSGIWRGNINFPAGNYIFTATSDDGVRLDVGDDGTQEIDEWFQQEATTYETVPISISGNKKIKLTWYEGPGDATITFGWRLDEEVDNTLNVRSEPPTGIVMDDGGVGKNNGVTNYTKTSSSNISTWINAPSIDPPGYTFVNWTGCDSIWSGDDKWCRAELSGGVTQTATAHYTTDTQPLSAPTNLSATAVSSSRVDLSWTANPDNEGVVGYWIVRDGVTINTTAGTTYQDNSVSPSTTYSYQVFAYDEVNNHSDLSNPASVTTPAVPDSQAPTVPTNLIATAVSTSQINLSWNSSTDNVGVTGYEIYRNGAKIATVSTTSYGDGGLSSSTTYSYFVKARDAAGNVSGASSTVSATTQGQPSTGTLVGQITKATNGDSVVGATVTIKIAGKKGKSALVATSTTNSSGVYAFNLNPGSYDIEVKVSGFSTQKKTATITSGATFTVNFSLDPKSKGGKKK